MKNKLNVIEFPKTDFEKEIDMLVKLFKENKVNNLVLAYTITDPADTKNPNQFATYWFGKDTCLYMLGLVRKLDGRILKWMADNNF